MPKSEHDPLAQLFREVVLVLGGVFAVQGTDDETIRNVAAGLESVWRRSRTRRTRSHAARLAPHPAIAALLRLVAEEDPA